MKKHEDGAEMAKFSKTEKLDLDNLKFQYVCGNANNYCEYPEYFCEVDTEDISRSQCSPCSTDICSTYGRSKNFPEACKLWCNPTEILNAVLSRNSKANDQQTYEVWFYFFMVLSILLLSGIAIYVIYIVFKNRRRRVMDKEASLSSLSENTGSEEDDEADKEETSVLIPFEPTKANDTKDDQENCAKVSESRSIQASDAHRPSLQQIIPSTTDNSTALNPIVTTAHRCFQGPSMTDGQNILASTTQSGVHASFD